MEDEERSEISGDSLLSETVCQPSTSVKASIRQGYRKLIKETQQNKEDLVKPDNNGLMVQIAKADQLFRASTLEPREIALDSRFMSLAVALGAQKTSHLQTDLIAFQPDEFTNKLITLLEGSVSRDDPEDVMIPDSGWSALGEESTKYFKSIVPAFHPLLGTFEKCEKPTVKHLRNKESDQNTKTQLPQHLVNYVGERKEATPAEIEKIYKVIKLETSPIDYFELITNPTSYGHTIENIFHLAFLVKDGLVRIFLNDNNLPVVEQVKGKKKNSNHAKETNQFIVSLSMDEWEEIVDTYQLSGREPYIKPTTTNKR